MISQYLTYCKKGLSPGEGNTMITFCFVRPEHLNHQGFLFGGQLLKWVDEYAWLAAARDFPGTILVTRAMDNIQFRKRVCNGAILRFDIRSTKRGFSSVTYTADVFASDQSSRDEVLVFTTHITFVAIGEQGEKIPLPESVEGAG
jgi:acyl-CoA hydrolase